MKLSDLGERAIIEKLGRFLDIGDDAACIRLGNRFLVLSTDMVYAPTHIPAEMTPRQIGKFIVTVNLSDLAAMGAKPLAFLLSYGGPDGDFRHFTRLIKAAQSQCMRYGTELVGGDTKETKELTLTGCAVGLAEKPVLRSGAMPGDIVAVTGGLGSAGMCFELLGKGLKPPGALLKSALEPEPRITEGILLGKKATSMTDISDSLALSLYSIAEKSRVGMRIDLDGIPIPKAAVMAGKKFGLDPHDHALYGGGDYQLLFTMPERDFSRIRNPANAAPIGRVTKTRAIMAEKGGKDFGIEKIGYQHFG